MWICRRTDTMYCEVQFWGLMCSGIWRYVVWWVDPGILKNHTAFILQGQADPRISTWMALQSLKQWEQLTKWHSVTSRKTRILSNTAVRTSNLARQVLLKAKHNWVQQFPFLSLSWFQNSLKSVASVTGWRINSFLYHCLPSFILGSLHELALHPVWYINWDTLSPLCVFH